MSDFQKCVFECLSRRDIASRSVSARRETKAHSTNHRVVSSHDLSGLHELGDKIRLNDSNVRCLTICHLLVDDRRRSEYELDLIPTFSMECLRNLTQGGPKRYVAHYLNLTLGMRRGLTSKGIDRRQNGEKSPHPLYLL
jgi:hypothetical protein